MSEDERFFAVFNYLFVQFFLTKPELREKGEEMNKEWYQNTGKLMYEETLNC